MAIITCFYYEISLVFKDGIKSTIQWFKSNLIFFYEKNKVKIKELSIIKFTPKENNALLGLKKLIKF